MVKKSTSYKLIVTPELEEKIRYYLGRFPNIEYSGTLFYTVSGGFETNDLVVNAIDFLLQDIGTGGYTEFNQSPDVIAYMVEHPELLDENVYQGLMHSHHVLGAFFSGTDDATLREEGSERIHFVSLIIDTKGTYKAAITRVVEEELTATGSVKYPTFNEKFATAPVSYTFTRKRLESFMLEVERPIIPNPYEELADRITEVQKQKAEKEKEIAKSNVVYGNGYNNYGYNSYNKPATPVGSGISYQTNVGRANLATPVIPNNFVNDPAPKPKLPFEVPIEDDNNDVPPPYGHVKVNPLIIDEIAKQLVTGDITYFDDDKTTLEELARASEELFNMRFEDEKLFHTWAEQYVEFLVYYTEDDSLTEYEDEVLAALIAHDLMEVLNKLTTKNKYIETFIEIIDRYII